jgi:hypothetical protein
VGLLSRIFFGVGVQFARVLKVENGFMYVAFIIVIFIIIVCFNLVDVALLACPQHSCLRFVLFLVFICAECCPSIAITPTLTSTFKKNLHLVFLLETLFSSSSLFLCLFGGMMCEGASFIGTFFLCSYWSIYKSSAYSPAYFQIFNGFFRFSTAYF